MSDQYKPTENEIKACLDFLSKTLVVTICHGDMEKKEVTTEGTGILLTEDELIFENYYSDRFGAQYAKDKFGSTIKMNGSFKGVNKEKADFNLTFSGQELNFPVNIKSNFIGGETEITVNGEKYPADELLEMLN